MACRFRLFSILGDAGYIHERSQLRLSDLVEETGANGVVQTNIEKFGGDPTRVKYNESAGAAAVQYVCKTVVIQKAYSMARCAIPIERVI
ncbi:hypothetical protein WG66_013532 [Moniliophthora roreri]|nr:hypothetical protein WG66_013532 [Moniliophthora roreri]